MRKRLIAALLICVSALIGTACGAENTADDTIDTTPAVIEEDDGGAVTEMPQNDGRTFVVDSFGFTAPEGFNVYDRDCTFTPEMCLQQNIDYEKMKQYMSIVGSQLIMIPQDEIYSDAFEINVRVKEKKYDDLDFRYLNNDDLQLFAGQLMTGFGKTLDDCTFYQTENTVFIEFEMFAIDKYEYRCATVADGHMIYIFGRSSEQITPEQIAQIRAVADSFRK